MRSDVKKVVAVNALLALAGGGALALPAVTAQAASSAPVSGYANVLPGDFGPRALSLPVERTDGQHAVTVAESQILPPPGPGQRGSYVVTFHGAGASIPAGQQFRGIALAHATGSAGGLRVTCVPGLPRRVGADLRVTVFCDSDPTNKIPVPGSGLAPFSVSYTDGHAEEGGLVVMATDPDNPKAFKPALNTSVSPSRQASSVGGKVHFTRTGTGTYRVSLPKLKAGAASHIHVSASSRGTTCALSGATSTTSTEKAVVVCNDVFTGKKKNAGFSLAYARGTSVLGSKNAVSDAHASVPLMTSDATVTPKVQRDRIYGDTSGKIKVTRRSKGTYTVTLGRQGQGLPGSGASVITANKSTASCQETTQSTGPRPSFDKILLVNCTSPEGAAKDTSFNISFSVRQ